VVVKGRSVSTGEYELSVQCAFAPTPPPFPPPGPQPPPSPPPPVRKAIARDACGDISSAQEELCVDTAEEHGVRCCGDWSGSVCITATKDDAEAACIMQGGCLCDSYELSSQCDTGCNHNSILVWSRTPCT